MKKFTTGFAKSIFAIFILSLLVSSGFAQSPVSIPRYHVEKPMYLPPEPYGIESVISVGAFDNYSISAAGGGFETDIIVNPSNPLNFVCTDNRITGFFGGGIYVFVTTDGGVNWTPKTITTNQGDPAFSADANNNIYLATLNNSVTGFVVYKSVDGGQNWTSSGFLPGGGITSIDKEWIAADQTQGTYKNYVYIAFVNFTSGAAVALMRSTNNGTSWSLVSSNLGVSNNNPGPDIAVDANGRVILAWESTGGTSVRTSTDGGTTWSSEIVADSHSQPGYSFGGRQCVQDSIRVNGMPHIAIDNTTGSHAGYIYDVYPTNPPGPDLADVYCAHSTDHGATWSSGVRVNNDATIGDQWMPDVSVDNQGRVWVIWWDTRNNLGTDNNELWGGLSTDGGQTFSNFKIGNQIFNTHACFFNQGSTNYAGDYQSISGKAPTFPCYVGMGNSKQDFTAYLPDYGISFSRAVDSINQNGSGPNVVSIPMMGNYSGTVTYTTGVSPSPAPGTITFQWSPSNVKVLTGTPDQVICTPVVSATVPFGTYTVTVTGTETGGPRVHARTFSILVGTFTGITQTGTNTPQTYQLFQNYPNPFNPSTLIYYAVPKATNVNITVYDILGRAVSTLVNTTVQAGDHTVTFDGTNFPSGIYYYRINADNFTDVRKMILIK